MTARMYWRCPDSVTVSTKSHAGSASAWLRRNAAQVVAARPRAGSMPSFAEVERPRQPLRRLVRMLF
ncbi:hypothetical protein [Catenulispora rubra]|uniref:hypothetical protein n=1 Tax=Catenulispora rubra TaxID=280293 RepID=UPI00189223DE|nr:hypothetical protein [Catenulispora rubra]